jgi:hypothetical protein
MFDALSWLGRPSAKPVPRTVAEPETVTLADITPEPQQWTVDGQPLADRHEWPQDPQPYAEGGIVQPTAAVTVDNRDGVFTPAPDAAPFHPAGPEPGDPGAANRTPDFPEPPDYRRPASRPVVRIDDAIEDNLRATSQRLRRDLRAEIDRRRVVELQLDIALARVAELDLTLRALGKVVVHAAGHDTAGGA